MAIENLRTTELRLGEGGFSGVTTADIKNGTNDNEFITALQNKLLGNSGAISSDTTPIDSMINDAISGLQQGQQLSRQGTQAAFERQRGYTAETGASTMTAELESRRGFGTNTAIVSKIQQDTEKSLRDLDLREQEALAAGATETASKIADLKIKQIEFKQQATQQAFQNLLGAAGIMLQQRGLNLQEKQQSFAERQAVSGIGLEYGVDTNGLTLDQAISKATPNASAKQKAELANLQARTREANANAQKALQGNDFVLDDSSASAIASSLGFLISTGQRDVAQGVLANILNSKGAKGISTIAKAMEAQAKTDLSETSIKAEFGKNRTFSEIAQMIENYPATPEMKKSALETATKLYKERPVSPEVAAGRAVGGTVGKFFSEPMGKTFSQIGGFLQGVFGGM